MERRDFEMSQADLDKILDACKSVPYLVAGGMEPRSPQENANDAWRELGSQMGFKHMTVESIEGKGDRFFTAEVAPKTYRDGDQWCAVMADFINLQESPAGFGDTREDARQDLITQMAS